MALFSDIASILHHERSYPGSSANLRQGREPTASAARFLLPRVDAVTQEVFACVEDPSDRFQLRDLYLGWVEAELGPSAIRQELASRWRSRVHRRPVSETDILTGEATCGFVKELFNFYFRDDLYGLLRSDDHIILSSGSVDHSLYSLPAVLKDCLHYALHRDWYGYSDSRGRLPTRDALAQLENVRVEGAPYTSANIVVAIGGTWTVSAVADFLGTCHRQDRSPALCGVPGYPPLVEAISRRQRVALIPLPLHDGFTRLDPLIEALRPDTPLVLLQSVINPTGSPVYEPDLARLIERAAPSTFVILDECHECLGPALQRSSARARRHVIRVNSLSKALSVPGMKIGWFTADVDVVRGFYEYASTSYGSPPSLFYLLLEVMARMERWLLEGLDRVGHEQYAEFEREYGLTEGALNTAFESYRRERLGHDADLIACRERTVAAAAEVGATVVPPSYSLNVLLKPPTAFHSYLSFRRTLARAGVATYPGGLCFGLDDGWLRVSPGVAPSSLCRALQRLQSMWREEGR